MGWGKGIVGIKVGFKKKMEKTHFVRWVFKEVGDPKKICKC